MNHCAAHNKTRKEYEDLFADLMSGKGVCFDDNDPDKLHLCDNHPDKTIARAMEVVIQAANMWEDGIRELTPEIKTYLTNALTTLQEYKDKNQWIESLIREGNYFLNHEKPSEKVGMS